METLLAMNDWGIYLDPKDKPKEISDDRMEEAGFYLLHPAYRGSIYFDFSGNYIDAEADFWFLPISQPGLFDSPYESMNDIRAEVEPELPELFSKMNVEEMLVKVNACVIFPADI